MGAELKYVWASAAVVLTTLGFCAVAFATSQHAPVNCYDFAAAATDEWSNGLIVPADDLTTASRDDLVLISAGHKYIVRRDVTVDGTLRPAQLGTLASNRNRVYETELYRCRKIREFKVYVSPE